MAGGNPKEVKRLLEAGADANMPTKRGWAPLHWVTALGHCEVAELLLVDWANVNAVASTGRKPLGMPKEEKMGKMLIAWRGVE